MAITIRLNEKQEQQLQEAMKLTGEATKSKTILYLIENAKRHITDRKELNELRSDIDNLFFTIDKISKHKIPY
ncbi:hypothetical protein K0I73_09445 [Shewanella mesophila]|uniref:hypothetical protein n=1 Tax=Shewanella mesophila TaxID=2864208 RepID=UPI001C6549D6|nr:hypothetical protein [Shewanella mesophila]QYJ87856.1 hypothetical protein K0I73_09365 [Shewanella mesophila]QYJ87864.1 hypothetical protein K0I73_09405 [Shewanella mesophila]QYJ87872.1 hypothetical protein K0I73_09445 [Shewanella mesophila]